MFDSKQKYFKDSDIWMVQIAALTFIYEET